MNILLFLGQKLPYKINMILKNKVVLLTLIVILFRVQSQAICSKNCVKCSDSTSCTECSLGYFIDDILLCKPCNPGCKICAAPSANSTLGPICTQCISNLNYDNLRNQCFTCDSLCSSCFSAPNNCTKCFEGYNLTALSGSNTCSRDQNCLNSLCLDCVPGSGQLCQSCLTGYFIKPDATCEFCPYPCSQCTLSVDPAQLMQQVMTGVQVVQTQIQTIQSFAFQLGDFFAKYQMYLIAKQINPSADLSTFLAGGDYSLLGDPANLMITVPSFSQKILDLENYFGFFVDASIFTLAEQQVSKRLTQLQTLINLALSGDATSLLTLQSQLQGLNSLTPESVLLVVVSQPEFKQYFNGTMDELMSNLMGSSQAPVTCSSCAHGFYYHQLIHLCLPCQQNCLHCNETDCHECPKGFILSNLNQCTRCQLPCSDCATTTTNCSQCVLPFQLNANAVGGGGQCINCQSPCLQCSSTNSSFCKKCISPFSQWPDSNGQCFRCAQDICEICQNTNITNCIDCSVGSVSILGICQPCPINCIECLQNISSNVLQCSQCRQNFFLNPTAKTCQKCTTNCIFCDPSTPQVCINCQNGAFRSSDGKCIRCPQFCLQCTNNQYCTIYKGNFLKFGDQFVQCRPGSSKCLGTNPEISLVCSPKFILLGSLCVRCAEGCQNCASARSDGCVQCSPERYLSSGVCLLCPQNCSTCSSQTVCTSCKRQFVLSVDKCVSAKSLCQKNCVNCDLTDNTKCLKCEFGFALLSSNKCVKCSSNCGASCEASNPQICTQCLIGFQLTQGRCVRCPKNCQLCSNGLCQACSKGYIIAQNINTTKCQKQCVYPCKRCQNTQCLQCFGNFLLINARCQSNVTCGSSCSFCQIGTFRNADQICEKCLDNCATCSNNSACAVCRQGYFSKINQCRACPQGSLTCLDQFVSSQCVNGYFLEATSIDATNNVATFSSVCKPCQSPCRQCFLFPTYCLSCINNQYRLNGTSCMKKMVIGVQIRFDFDYSMFLEQGLLQSVLNTLQEKTSIAFVLTYIYNGSTVLGVAGGSASNSGIVSSTIAGGSLGIPIISSSVGLYFEDKEVEDNKGDVNLGALIGGVIAGFIVLLVIVGVIVYKCKKNGNKVQQEKKSIIDKSLQQKHQQLKEDKEIMQRTNEQLNQGENKFAFVNQEHLRTQNYINQQIQK